MASHYWIKLYLDMLDNAKVGALPDWAHRCWIDFLLAAGEHNRAGLLPSIPDLAWRIRRPKAEVVKALRLLTKAGLLCKTQDGWLILQFADRQAAPPSTERVKRFRMRQKSRAQESKPSAPAAESETDLKREETPLKRDETPIDIDTESESEKESEKEVQRAAEAEEEASKPPAPSHPPKWPQIPDAITAERIFQNVTSMVTFPGRTRDSDIERICAMYDRYKTGTVDYLQPYWQAWNRRGYNRVNTGWLDWAVSGQIPKGRDRRPGKSPPKSPGEDLGTDDPTVVSAYHYLKNNPRGFDRQGATQRLQAKGYRYADGKLVQIGSSA